MEDVKVQKAPAKIAPIGMPETVRIILEDDDSIPPTGLFIGLNGKGYLLRTTEEADVPLGVKEILDHAVMSMPVVDPQTRRVIGHKERLRFNYRVVTK